MPLDTNSRTDDIVDGISRLVLDGGFERVTPRAIVEVQLAATRAAAGQPATASARARSSATIPSGSSAE